MSEVIAYLENLLERVKQEGDDIMNRSTVEGRPMTDLERAKVVDLKQKAENYQKEIASRQEDAELRKRFETDQGWGNGEIRALDQGKGSPERPRSLGEAFIQSGAFRAIQERAKGGRLGENWRSETAYVDHLNAKAAAMPVLESGSTSIFGTGSANAVLQTAFGLEAPGFLFEGTKRPMIADLIPSIQITVGNTATYPVVSDRNQLGLSDMPISEGGTKKSVGYDFDAVVKQLRKHAAYTKVSEELLQDAPAIAAYINADLPFQIQQVEDAYLADALYTAALAAPSISGATQLFDQILEAIADVANSGGNPDGLIIHPNDWYGGLMLKSVAGDGAYFAGGPFGSAGRELWNTVRPVVTQAATAGTPLVGDFARGAKLYRKGGISVDATNSDGTDFIKNLVTIRAEERLIIGVTYPELFSEVVMS